MPSSIEKQYEDGLPGYVEDVRERIEYLESQPKGYFAEPNIRGSGKGKRALLWQYLTALDATAFTEKQTTGDCVSHGSRGARDVTRACAIMVRRQPFDFYKRGATEPTYGARGHSGQGMSPARASRFERDTGFLSREDHGVVDLSVYKSSIGTGWGARGVPQDVMELCRKNKVNNIQLVKTQDDLMDAMVNGYAAHSGQYAAWSSTASNRNVHERKSGGWAHDMAIVGYDDTREFWPFRVWFIANSWGNWNRPVSDWPSSYPKAPGGLIVTSADDFDVCVRSSDCWVYGGIDGYPPQKLPDLGTIGMLNND